MTDASYSVIFSMYNRILVKVVFFSFLFISVFIITIKARLSIFTSILVIDEGNSYQL